MTSLSTPYEASKAARANMNKSEAASYLHQEYSAYIYHHGLEDQHPDFHSIISENVRAFNSPSAIATGYPRGNRSTYGKIEFYRKGNKPYFSKSQLQAFFHLRYVPKMLKTLIVAPTAKLPYAVLTAVGDAELDQLLREGVMSDAELDQLFREGVMSDAELDQLLREVV